MGVYARYIIAYTPTYTITGTEMKHHLLKWQYKMIAEFLCIYVYMKRVMKALQFNPSEFFSLQNVRLPKKAHTETAN